MRKFLGLMGIAALLALAPVAALAADVPAEVVPPDWLVAVLMFLQSIPAVGGIIAKVVMWAGVLSSVMTAVSLGVQGILMGLSAIAGFAGLAGVAEQIKALSEKVLPWLKYFSMFNVQKKV